jgi:cytochrome c-type biogenesis protein CcsB
MGGAVEQALTGQWLLAAMAAYGLTAVVGGAGEILRKPMVRRLGIVLLGVACVYNAAMIGSMWVGMGRPPFKTLYETLLLAPFCIAAVGLLMIWLHRLSLLTAFAALGALICLYCAYRRPDWEVVLLPPALQSAWFVPHVITYFISYAALFISFVLAALALFQGRNGDKQPQAGRASLPVLTGTEAGPTTPLAEAAHKSAVFGFVTLTLGLAMGAAWGKGAWGDYWQWDPKENWALITWLCYLAYQHLRLLGPWRGKRALWVNIACFGAVMFTYLGMHLLPTAGGSLHVYQ